jgi:hypothetical protein
METPTTPATPVTPSKKYYEKHRNTILAKEKENKRWLSYYERNKEAIKERNITRYYSKQGRERPEPRPVPPPVDNSKVERLEALVKELRELVPHVVRKPRKMRVPATMTVPVFPSTNEVVYLPPGLGEPTLTVRA